MSKLDAVRKAWTKRRLLKKLQKLADKKRAEHEPFHFMASLTHIHKPVPVFAGGTGQTPQTSMKKHPGWARKRARRRVK